MTLTAIDLRTPHKNQDDLPGLQALLAAQLVGEIYLSAGLGYADELRMHFGTPREYTLPRFGKRTAGSHVLSLRGSAWVLKPGQWDMAIMSGLIPGNVPPAFGQPLSREDWASGAFAEPGSPVHRATPFLHVPVGGIGLQLILSNGTQLTVFPTSPEPDQPGDENLPPLADWELLTPRGFLRVGPGTGWEYEPSRKPPAEPSPALPPR
jgi:hypothetical protein